jgi:F-type H+-transporting ATPase subunit gamma
MAKARALDKRRRSIRNIRKITRTMELIATARYKKAMDRATAASAYTRRMTEVVAEIARTGVEVSHPLLEVREKPQRGVLLVLTANRGLCGGYNAAVFRTALARYEQLQGTLAHLEVDMVGKRGIAAAKFKHLPLAHTYTEFTDQPRFEQVDPIAVRYLDAFATRQLDRLDVAYMKFLSSSKQTAVVERLLPLASLEGEPAAPAAGGPPAGESRYEFLPSAASILEEIVPASFKARLFKCFLDAAVSEQIARMVAMKSATENATEMIKQLSIAYNRARQSQITREIMEVIGGVEALKG